MSMWKILLLVTFAKYVTSANILFITMVASPSHHIWNEVLAAGLVEKGHNITMIGHNDLKIKPTNLTLLKVAGIEKVYKDIDFNGLLYKRQTAFEDIVTIWKYVIAFCKNDLSSDALEILLNYPRDMFDLIVFDVTGGQYFYPLINYFGNPPVVGVSPFGLAPFILDTMGSHFCSYIPIYVLPYTDEMTFLQRLHNIVFITADYYFKHQALNEMFNMAEMRFGEDIIPFPKVEQHMSVLLANYDPSLNFPQSLPPNVIPVGGIHIQRQTKLPDDVKQILDTSNQGVIFFSFGTNLEPSSFSIELKKIFLDTFSKLKETVLWKYDGDDLKDVPKNVIIRKWYPQNSILGHKNVKLFITHCGCLSSQETIYYGVPILGIPIIIDQRNNAKKLVAKMLGKQLEINTLTEDLFYESILEVINNPIYRQNIQRISQEYRDQKESPLERATYWVEHVLRRKDLSYLSIRAREMTVFERENLDVFGFLFVLIIVFVVLLYMLLKIVYRQLFAGKVKKVKLN